MTVTEALLALAAPEPRPYGMRARKPEDWVLWDEWNTRRIEALELAAALQETRRDG